MLGPVARRPGGKEEADPARIIGRARLDPAHRSERAMRHVRFARMSAVLPAIADRSALLRRSGDVIAGRGHAERAHDLGLDMVLIGPARDVGDDPAEQGIAEIGIFEGGLRRAGEGDAGAKHPGEIGLGQHLLAIAPRIVGDEAAGVRKQVADPDSGGIAGRIAPALHLRDVGFGERVEREPAFVAQLQYGERGEGLGHGGDSEQAFGIDRAIGSEVLPAERADVDEPPFLDDAPDQAGHVRLGGEGAETLVQAGENLLQRKRDRRRRLNRLRPGGTGQSEQQRGDQGEAHGPP